MKSSALKTKSAVLQIIDRITGLTGLNPKELSYENILSTFWLPTDRRSLFPVAPDEVQRQS